MATTQSGFPVIDDYSDPQLVSNPLVPGSDVRILGGLRAGDVATVLLYVAERFHREVEPLVQDKGNWGYGKREIRGGSGWSNHAGGCAVDLNAAVHAQHVRGTFNRQQVAAIHAIVETCDGVVGWGGDWDDAHVDEMHFQIDNDQAPNVPRLAERLRVQPPAGDRDFLEELLAWNR